MSQLWKLRLATWALIAAAAAFLLKDLKEASLPARIIVVAAGTMLAVVHMLFEWEQERRIAFERPRALAFLDSSERLLRRAGPQLPPRRFFRFDLHRLQPSGIPRLRLWMISYGLVGLSAALLFLCARK